MAETEKPGAWRNLTLRRWAGPDFTPGQWFWVIVSMLVAAAWCVYVWFDIPYNPIRLWLIAGFVVGEASFLYLALDPVERERVSYSTYRGLTFSRKDFDVRTWMGAMLINMFIWPVTVAVAVYYAIGGKRRK